MQFEIESKVSDDLFRCIIECFKSIEGC